VTELAGRRRVPLHGAHRDDVLVVVRGRRSCAGLDEHRRDRRAGRQEDIRRHRKLALRHPGSIADKVEAVSASVMLAISAAGALAAVAVFRRRDLLGA